MLFREFLKRGYDAVPVNPQVSEIEGRPCFPSIGEVQPAVEAALLMTSPSVSEVVVRDCAQAGVRQVWFYRAAGTGAVSPAAVAFCAEKGIAMVDGECPFMFFPNAGLGHRIHGWCKKLMGSYPA